MQKHARFSALDGLRGFAAIGVFLYHGADIVGFRLSSGYLAVDFFFCLSGFVIAAAYEQRLLAGETFLEFLTTRLTRLYPVYLLGMAIGLFFFAVTAFSHGGSHAEPLKLTASIVLGLAFLPSPPDLVQSFSTRTFPFVIQAWSLFYEIAANLLYAATVQFLTTGRLILFLLLILPLLVVATVSFGSLDLGPEWATMIAGFARAFFSFFAGVLVFRLRSAALVLPAWVAWFCVIVLTSVLLLGLSGPTLRPLYDLLVVVLLFPALTLFASAASEASINRAVFTFLGAASYPLYLLHGPIVSWINDLRRIPELGPERISHSVWLLLFAAIVLASALIDLFYERPAIRWLRTKLAL